MIDGLVGGIRNAWEGAKEIVSGLGNGIKGWFAEKLGIHSPSRVFKGYGVNVVEGLAIGMDKAQPLATQASQNLSSAVKFACFK
ncbi:putative bacteriophage tail protein/phage tail tape measure protein, TP901 family [Avibacterium paragallinarum]|uniref:Putative bacteriophage tail protein/phage tail tape measure protein, TP901 family n=1 Tax=Avibacterium paragallinarum TaxID=728 RepID=A0A377I4A3_AVIPA|nr:putative bacteriophage tail protein/phage tail tape measure protein, TP901 family [Avibacterium paragallinarum]